MPWAEEVGSMTYDLTILVLHQPDPASDLPIWKGPSTTFGEKMATIRSWMQECRQHVECKPVPFAPRRLLSVGLDGTPPRLVERSSTIISSEYAALSYCWGDCLPLRTTQATLSFLCERIPLELMPKTFVDAIQIARSLQIPYLWIDALCIVQDEEQEWQEEAAAMADIYRGSVLNITAADSTDSSQGCFPAPPPRSPGGRDDGVDIHDGLFFRVRLPPARKCADSGAGDGGDLLAVRIHPRDVRSRATSDSAVSQRGWTLQERLLSQRVVYCMSASSDMHWQCRAAYQTETGMAFPTVGSVGSNTASLGLAGPAQWRNIVRLYSFREFTYPQDRIPAMAGITRYFAAQLDDTPLLGLWSRSFAADLAWLRGGGEPQLMDVGGLPSWTWLACRGSVLYTMGSRYDEESMRVDAGMFRLVDWEVEWKGVAYTSPVKRAWARVQGLAREIRIRPSEAGNRYIPPYFEVFDEELELKAVADTAGNTTKIPWRCAGRFDGGDRLEEATYLCMLLFLEREDDSGRAKEVFLILEPAENSSGRSGEPCYRRVGLARIWEGEAPAFEFAKSMSLVLV